MAGDKQAEQWLRDGIRLVQQGQRGRGRALLLRAVERAADLEAGWWWLSQASDNTAERQHALQKVLALNPEHAEARAKLVELRLKRLPTGPLAAPAAQAAAWASALPEAPLEADDGIDNPFQCPYCGEPTGSDDKRCLVCHRGLYRRVALSGNSEILRRLQLILGIGLAIGILELASPLLALGFRQSNAVPANFDMLLAVPGVEQLLGNFLTMAPATIELLLKLLGARAVVFVLLILGVRARWRVAYYGTMLGMVADLLLGVYLLVGGHLGWVGLVLNMVLSFSAGLLLFAVSYEFAVNHERLLVRPDLSARGPLDFYRRGHEYRRQGMWAMAVAQWRKAVGLAPREPDYYKDLGVGYAQIGRYDRSLRALHEGRRQSTNPAEIDQIIALVEAKARKRGGQP